ncbi:hypothetical protein KM043_007261 [Ampulex compressa]|nr:hypothetical protein KM043_007261 [Ampulex compressa]
MDGARHKNVGQEGRNRRGGSNRVYLSPSGLKDKKVGFLKPEDLDRSVYRGKYAWQGEVRAGSSFSQGQGGYRRPPRTIAIFRRSGNEQLFTGQPAASRFQATPRDSTLSRAARSWRFFGGKY